MKRRGTQGLELTLGFYEDTDKAIVDHHDALIAEELSRTLGGFAAAVQLRCTVLPDTDQWLGTGVKWPAEAAPPRHLHRYVLRYRDQPPLGREPDHLHSPEWLVIARRLRYRVGVDHANGTPDAFWWTTPQTETWIERARQGSDSREVNYFVSGVLTTAIPSGVSADPAANSADDWGCVRLSEDPIRVLAVGPYSAGAETHSDVTSTLALAGNQLHVETQRLRQREARFPLLNYAEHLQHLSRREDLLEAFDVVLVYRGGGLRDVSPQTEKEKDPRGLVDDVSRASLANAVRALAGQGIEVVLGMGHGTTAVYRGDDELPVGVFEAVTPTAAANWIVREHVNNRLAFSRLDPGQPRP